MGRRVKVGVVGCGTVAELFYLDAIVEYSHRIELTALCDVVPGRAEAAARRWGAESWFEDLDDMLASSEIEAVLVLTKHSQHYEHCKKVLESGRHLGIEKPIAHSFELAKEVVALAETQGLKLCAAPAMMFEPVAQRTNELLSGGAIGTVYYVRTQMIASPADRETEWRRQGPNLGRISSPPTDQTWMYQAGEGGPLADLTAYQLIPILRHMGPVKRVAGLSGVAIRDRVAMSGPTSGQRFETTAPDNNAILLDWGGSRFGVCYSGYLPQISRGPSLEFYGDEGVLVVNGGTGEDSIEIYRERPEFGYGGWVPAGKVNSGWDIVQRAGAITHLVDCILDDTEVEMSGRQALHILEVTELARESSESGQYLKTTTAF